MAETEFTEEERAEAYEEARREIEEVAVSSADYLRLNRNATRALTVLPPEIADLGKLKSLDLDNTQVSDLRGLEGLSGLQALTLSNTQISDLRGLEGLSGLQALYLSNTQVNDLSGLEGLNGLQTLHLTYTQVSDLRVVLTLPRIREAAEERDVPYGVFFKGALAAKTDPELRRISEIEDKKDRTLELLDYLETLGPVEPELTEAEADAAIIKGVAEVENEFVRPDLDAIFQDGTGWTYGVSAEFAAFILHVASVEPESAATQLLPGLRVRLADAVVACSGTEAGAPDGLSRDLAEMNRIASQPMAQIATEAIHLWQLSVGLAHYLDEDAAAEVRVVNRPTLGPTRRGALGRLMTSSAAFVRQFPDAAAMDDALGGFLLKAHERHLAPALFNAAAERGMLTPESVRMILDLARLSREEEGNQPDKAGAVTIKGKRNFLALAAVCALSAVGGGILGGFSEAIGDDLWSEAKLGIRALHYFKDEEVAVREFIKDLPDGDLKSSVESALDAAKDVELPPLPPIKPIVPMPPVKPRG